MNKFVLLRRPLISKSYGSSYERRRQKPGLGRNSPVSCFLRKTPQLPPQVSSKPCTVRICISKNVKPESLSFAMPRTLKKFFISNSASRNALRLRKGSSPGYEHNWLHPIPLHHQSVQIATLT